MATPSLIWDTPSLAPQETLAAIGGKVMMSKAAEADSPHGGLVIFAAIAAEPDNGKYSLKDKDTGMAAAFTYLREHGAFPEDEGDDDDDEPCFGDDAFDDIDNM